MKGDEARFLAFDEWWASRDDVVKDQLRGVWGKSAGLEMPNPLLQHLLDALCVADLIWDRFLARRIRSRVEEIAGGRGRELWRWLAGVHDLGKATPAFEVQAGDLSARLASVGLPIPPKVVRAKSQKWRHDQAGATFLRGALTVNWAKDHVDWVWPIVGGHHGCFYSSGQAPTESFIRRERGERDRLHGGASWDRIRRELLEGVTIAAGFSSVGDACPSVVPTRGDQLAIAGFVVMADWVSSDGEHFGGLVEPSLALAQQRAVDAWRSIGLHGGWGDLPAPPEEPFMERFGIEPRPIQRAVAEACSEVGAPPLMLIEAPMGEGKTEAALVAIEILAHRFGCDGALVGMPTQATADPMLTRFSSWLENLSPGTELALLHGRSAFNEAWQAMLSRSRGRSAGTSGSEQRFDEFGVPVDEEEFDLGAARFNDICGDASHKTEERGGDDDLLSSLAVAQWFFGRHRALLSPNVICTIDHALFAATRTRTAAVRFAGLAGKVVVLDEVHAADAFMTEFLVELLDWLGRVGAPVVLLSATLAASQRERLLAAYAGGATNNPQRPVEAPQPLASYPAVTATWADGGKSVRRTWVAPASKKSVDVTVEIVEDDEALLSDRVPALVDPGGGCVLVIRNTVDRAQSTAAVLRQRYGDDVVLLHSRFTTRQRADTTDRLVAELGPTGERPRVRFVVATQVAEQSFDVDADLLVTDLAPVDLLMQRIGRLHRHDRDSRPSALARPQVLVTGVEGADTAEPKFDGGSEKIYGKDRLLRSLAALRSAPWTVPSNIAPLVEQAYSEDPGLPVEWVDSEAEARRSREAAQAIAVAEARNGCLAVDGSRVAPTLEDLSGGVASIRDVEQYIRVRSGDSGEEVLLVVQSDGRYRTLAGVDLGVQGERARVLDPVSILGDSVRLPAFDRSLNDAARNRTTLNEWIDHPWLSQARVVELNDQLEGELDGRLIRYSFEAGLMVGGPK